MSTNPNNMFANRPTNIANPFGKVINISYIYRNQIIIIIIIQILIHLITPIQIQIPILIIITIVIVIVIICLT